MVLLSLRPFLVCIFYTTFAINIGRKAITHSYFELKNRLSIQHCKELDLVNLSACQTIMNEVHTFNLFAMQEALREAQQAFEEDEVPIGAIITQQEKIIARAHNQTQALHDPTAHAEMLAITAACNVLGSYNLARCTLYVSVEPCPMCAGALQWAQIGAVYYGASDTKRGYSLYSPNLLHARTTVRGGIMQEDAIALLQLFFRKKR